MQRPGSRGTRTGDSVLRKIENSEVVTIHNSEYTFLCSVSLLKQVSESTNYEQWETIGPKGF